jgi:hypothetical protein
MVRRCNAKKAANYKRYGGRGIKVCDEWLNIENFEKWVNESGYKEGLTIERVDNDGDYCPQNCRWATRKEQANNRSSNVIISYDGEQHNLTEWSEIKGISRSTLINRHSRGMNPPELFEKKVAFKGNTWIINEKGKRKWINVTSTQINFGKK